MKNIGRILWGMMGILVCIILFFSTKSGEEFVEFKTTSLDIPISLAKKIFINTATKEELMRAKGIGEVLAERIILYREKTPFTSVEDLIQIKGISRNILENNMDLFSL